MSDISTVVQKAEKLCQLARGAVVEAAAGLGALVVEQAPHTSLEELKRRLDRAIEQLEAKLVFDRRRDARFVSLRRRAHQIYGAFRAIGS